MRKIITLLFLLPNIITFSYCVNSTLSIPAHEACDVIVYNDGEEEEVKIVEVSESLIRYKPCDLQDGPVYSVGKSNVASINYSNGMKKKIRSQDKALYNNKSTDEKETKRKNLWKGLIIGITAVVAAVIGYLVL